MLEYAWNYVVCEVTKGPALFQPGSTQVLGGPLPSSLEGETPEGDDTERSILQMCVKVSFLCIAHLSTELARSYVKWSLYVFTYTCVNVNPGASGRDFILAWGYLSFPLSLSFRYPDTAFLSCRGLLAQCFITLFDKLKYELELSVLFICVMK